MYKLIIYAFQRKVLRVHQCRPTGRGKDEDGRRRRERRRRYGAGVNYRGHGHLSGSTPANGSGRLKVLYTLDCGADS